MGEQFFPGKWLCPFPVLVSAQHPWQAVWSRPTVRPRLRRMESGPRNRRLAGWLGGKELNLCHQHTSVLTKSILRSFGRLSTVWMGSGRVGSWPGERRSNTTRAGLATTLGAPTFIHLLFHASGETLGLRPHGPFVFHWSIFAWTCRSRVLTMGPCVLQPRWP